MSDHDFDIDSLAAYLHMMPAQISRLAERGKLPGRRVGKQWKFSRAEIHHWLEQRIGLSDEGELAEMEDVLERASQPSDQDTIRISDLLRPEAIAVPLDGRTRSSVISKMTELAAQSGMLWDADKMADAVEAREQMHSTALDNGVALLHPRRPMSSILGEAVIALGIKPGGVPFGSRSLTDIFFLICSTSDHEHLRVLARLSRIVSDVETIEELRYAPDVQSAWQTIATRESTLE